MIERETKTITIEVVTATCGRCGYKWELKRGIVPKLCARCKSPYWNAERKHKPHERRAGAESPASIEAARAAIDASRLPHPAGITAEELDEGGEG